MSAISIPEAVNSAVQRIEGMSDRALRILIAGYWITDIATADYSPRSVELWWRMSGYFNGVADRVDGK